MQVSLGDLLSYMVVKKTEALIKEWSNELFGVQNYKTGFLIEH